MFHKVLDLFFPERCILCDAVMKAPKNQMAVCSRCVGALIFLDEVPTCRICGCQTDPSMPLCNTCQTHIHYFDRAVSCFLYKDAVRRSILSYKFGSRRDYARTLGMLIYRRVLPLHQKEPFDCVLCVPMTRKDLLERGYHQTALLAGLVAKNLGIPFLPDAFSKSKDTRKQSSLDYQERFKNVDGAFTLALSRHQLKGKHILLIDDVLTTGATADALSKLLRKANVSRITVATIATTQEERVAPVTKADELMVTY